MDPADYYKAPKSDLDSPAAAAGPPLEAKLYSVRQIGVATFLGGPLAGGLLMAANYRANNRGDSARNAVIAGVVASIVLAVLGVILPDRVPNSALPIVYVTSMHAAAKAMQGPWLTPHFAAGGATQSNWRVVGIGLGSMAGLLASALVILLLTGNLQG